MYGISLLVQVENTIAVAVLTGVFRFGRQCRSRCTQRRLVPLPASSAHGSSFGHAASREEDRQTMSVGEYCTLYRCEPLRLRLCHWLILAVKAMRWGSGSIQFLSSSVNRSRYKRGEYGCFSANLHNLEDIIFQKRQPHRVTSMRSGAHLLYQRAFVCLLLRSIS